MAKSPSSDVFRAIVDDLDVGVYVVDRFRKITYWNHGAEKITGYLRQEVVGRFCRDNILVHCDREGHEVCGDNCPLRDAIGEGTPHGTQIYLRHQAGHRVPVHVRTIPLRDEKGGVTGAAEVFVERVEAPEFATQDLVLAACGCLDEQTGMPNHALTESYLRECLALFQNHRIQFAVFVVRADGLDAFQTQHGKDAAIAILRAITHTLRHALPPTDFVGRWGPDRFLITLPYAGRAPLERGAERLQHLVRCTSVPWWGDQLSIAASTSLTRVQDGDTLETLKDRIDAGLPTTSQPGARRTEGASA